MRIGLGNIFVLKAGDTMSGSLTISTSAPPALILNNTGGGNNDILRFEDAGSVSYTFQVFAADPKLQLTDGGGVTRLTLNMATGVFGTAVVPQAVIGDSGSVTINAVAAGSITTSAITPAGMTGKTAIFYNVRNSVAVANNGSGYTGNINQTDLRGVSIGFNSDGTTTQVAIAPAAGQSILGGKNTNAAAANLTFDWASVGR